MDVMKTMQAPKRSLLDSKEVPAKKPTQQTSSDFLEEMTRVGTPVNLNTTQVGQGRSDGSALSLEEALSSDLAEIEDQTRDSNAAAYLLGNGTSSLSPTGAMMSGKNTNQFALQTSQVSAAQLASQRSLMPLESSLSNGGSAKLNGFESLDPFQLKSGNLLSDSGKRQLIGKGNFEVNAVAMPDQAKLAELLAQQSNEDIDSSQFENNSILNQAQGNGFSPSHSSHSFESLSGAGLLNGAQVLSVNKNGIGTGGVEKGGKARLEMSGGDYLTTLGVVQNSTLNPTLSKFDQSHLGSQNQQGGQPGLLGKLNTLQSQAKENKLKFNEELTDIQKMGVLQAADNQYNSANATGPKPSLEMNAQVVPGAMAKDQFSTDSLIGISSNVRNLSLHGGGSMRVRLRPENLGELNIHVFTEGNKVALHIQASNEKTKAILEENLKHLKESLTAQHLTLSQVELSIGNSSFQSDSQKNDNMGQSAFQNFSSFNENFAQNSQHQSRHESFAQQFGSDGERDLNRIGKPQPLRVASGIETARVGRGGDQSKSRLDVRA